MMRTVSVSIPYTLADRVDLLAEQGEYASRAEVIRSALRFFLTLTVKEPNLEFTPFVRQPLEEVETDLLEAGYNKKFAKSVVAGLKKSSIYQ